MHDKRSQTTQTPLFLNHPAGVDDIFLQRRLNQMACIGAELGVSLDPAHGYNPLAYVGTVSFANSLFTRVRGETPDYPVFHYRGDVDTALAVILYKRDLAKAVATAMEN